jgi:hypothetical protein
MPDKSGPLCCAAIRIRLPIQIAAPHRSPDFEKTVVLSASDAHQSRSKVGSETYSTGHRRANQRIAGGAERPRQTQTAQHSWILPSGTTR